MSLAKRDPVDDAEAVRWKIIDDLLAARAREVAASTPAGEEIEVACHWLSCYDDDVEVACSKCGRAICHRPYHDASHVVYVWTCAECFDPALLDALCDGVA